MNSSVGKWQSQGSNQGGLALACASSTEHLGLIVSPEEQEAAGGHIVTY